MKKTFLFAVPAIVLSLTAACSKDDGGTAQERTDKDIRTSEYIIRHLDELIGQHCSPDSVTYFLNFYYHFSPDFVYCAHKSEADGLVDITAVRDESTKAAFYARVEAYRNGAKELTYETKDSAAFYQWVGEQVKKGNWVVSHYDTGTGTYIGTSFEPGELPGGKVAIIKETD